MDIQKIIETLENDVRERKDYFAFFGRTFTLRKARKQHSCEHCYTHIDPGDRYYEATIASSGVQGLTAPERLHIGCVISFLNIKRGG